jgi:hypothetical protein
MSGSTWGISGLSSTTRPTFCWLLGVWVAVWGVFSAIYGMNGIFLIGNGRKISENGWFLSVLEGFCEKLIFFWIFLNFFFHTCMHTLTNISNFHLKYPIFSPFIYQNHLLAFILPQKNPSFHAYFVSFFGCQPYQ